MKELKDMANTTRHPPCGGCGLKCRCFLDLCPFCFRHPPCGGCGLKSQIYRGYARGLWSPSVWRVWIEIDTRCCPRCRSGRHPPCGGCGLKSSLSTTKCAEASSPSVWRVWIEILAEFVEKPYNVKSPSVWRVWIEIIIFFSLAHAAPSPSVWRVWIEITR